MPVNKGRKRTRSMAGTRTVYELSKPSTKKKKISHALSEQRMINQVNLNPYRFISQRRSLPTEIKFVDLANLAIMATAGTVRSLCQIAQGISESQRIGSDVFIKNVCLRYNVLQDLTSPNTTDTVRIMVFIDTETVGVTPGASDVLQSSSPFSHYNWGNRGRFKYLYDEVITLNKVSKPQADVLVSIPIRQICRYDGTGATDVQRNNVNLLYLCSAGSNQPSIQYNIRTKYMDR